MVQGEAGNVFIVGGQGFVGAHVVRAFVGAGYRVHVFGPRMADDRLAEVRGRITEIEGSIEDAAAVRTALLHSEATSAVSLAAHSHGTEGLLRAGEADAERALAVNVLGFRHLLEAARPRSGEGTRSSGLRRVLWASSTVVYGPARHYAQPVDEAQERRPQSFYGLTKVLAEDVAGYYRERFGLETTALRLPLVCGPGLWYQGAAASLARLFEDAAPGREVAIQGPAEPFDLIYVKDAAAAFLAAHDFPGALAERYNVNGFTTTYAEIIAAVSDLVPDYHVHFTPEHPPTALPLVDHRRIEHDTGFRPRHGLVAMAKEYLEALEETRA